MVLRQVIGMSCLALILALTGCGAGSDGNGGAPESGAAPGSAPSQSHVDFRPESIEQLPAEVKKHLDQLTANPQGGHASVPHGSRIYLMIAAGQRPTGGYQVRITDVVRNGKTIHVYAEEIAPPPGSMVTQVFTHPAAVVSISQTDEAEYQFHLKKAREETQPQG